MNRLLLSAGLLSLLTAGCGHAGLEAHPRTGLHRGTSVDSRSANRTDASAGDAESAASDAESIANSATSGRRPGDYVAFRFSGSFRKAPLLLTQRVVARDGDVLVVDMTLEGGKATETMRVRMSDSPANRDEIVGAAWVEDGEERPATLSAYEAMMAKTALAADANDEVLGSESTTVQVGGAPLACQKTSYRVRIGATNATMETLQSDAFAWGDVGGEITAEDGRVLYRAELIDAGHAAPQPVDAAASAGARAGSKSATPATIAQSDYED
jgi:hypothetical protein